MEQGPFPDRTQRNQKKCVKDGHSYERKVERHLRRLDLGELCSQQWIMFADDNGLGWARPDIYVLLDNLTLIFEAKLTQSKTAEVQLLSLYLPLLRHVYETPMLLIQVCRNLRVVPNKLVDGPEDLLQNPGPGVYTWHFLGH